MPLHMHTCLCACIVLYLNFMTLSINNYHIFTNTCLKCSKSLMSARQQFVVLFSCSDSWCVLTLRMESMDCDRESSEA